MRLNGLFITATDTGVGKTYVAALIADELAAKGMRVGAYKPVCSGAHRDATGRLVWEDVEVLYRTIGRWADRDRICPQRFAAPLAPPVAASQENRTVDPQLLRDGVRWWTGKVDILLVEGVGGLLCPITEHQTVADLAGDLGFPLIIVAHNRLGTINHTLLTVEVARHRRLTIAAIVLNDPPCSGDPETGNASDASTQTNAQQIAARLDIPICIVDRDGRTAESCPSQPRHHHRCIDWRDLAGARRSGNAREAEDSPVRTEPETP